MDRNQWLASGEHLQIEGHQVWHRVSGEEGPWTTFLHGFPTSSFDWHKVAALLPGGRRRLFLDHLGFGASDKPAPYTYSFDEQIRIVQALWRHHGVEETTLVAHDYSVSMVQEILARHNRGEWHGPRIAGVVLLNGGLFYSLQERLPIQTILRAPVVGPVAGRFVNRAAFAKAMHRIAHPDRRMTETEIDDHWERVSSGGGARAVPYISRYHAERKENEQRWLGALQYADRPIRLLWGLADPISGGPMVERVAHQTSTVRVVAWDDVGHYPQLEVPDRVARHIAEVEAKYEPFAAYERYRS